MTIASSPEPLINDRDLRVIIAFVAYLTTALEQLELALAELDPQAVSASADHV